MSLDIFSLATKTFCSLESTLRHLYIIAVLKVNDEKRSFALIRGTIDRFMQKVPNCFTDSGDEDLHLEILHLLQCSLMRPMSLESDISFSLEYDSIVRHRILYTKYSINEEFEYLQEIIAGYIDGLEYTIKENPVCTYLHTALIGYLKYVMSFVSELVTQINGLKTSKASDTKFFA